MIVGLIVTSIVLAALSALAAIGAGILAYRARIRPHIEKGVYEIGSNDPDWVAPVLTSVSALLAALSVLAAGIAGLSAL